MADTFGSSIMDTIDSIDNSDAEFDDAAEDILEEFGDDQDSIIDDMVGLAHESTEDDIAEDDDDFYNAEGYNPDDVSEVDISLDDDDDDIAEDDDDFYNAEGYNPEDMSDINGVDLSADSEYDDDDDMLMESVDPVNVKTSTTLLDVDETPDNLEADDLITDDDIDADDDTDEILDDEEEENQDKDDSAMESTYQSFGDITKSFDSVLASLADD